jgi:hypothetical protein
MDILGHAPISGCGLILIGLLLLVAAATHYRSNRAFDGK